MSNPSQPQVMTIREAAARLGVSRQTIYNLEGRGLIRVIRIGRVVRVPNSELTRLIEGQAGPAA